MLTPEQAYQRLVVGNARYVNREQSIVSSSSQSRQAEVAPSQSPFAIVLSCADSRVPPEIIFDQGLGDLFVVRVAGNIVTPEMLGSIEFAVSSFGTQLIVVLGHTKCGAIGATLGQIASPNENLSPNLSTIVDGVRPAVMPLIRQSTEHNADIALSETVASMAAAATRANVAASVSALQTQSAVLVDAEHQGKLTIVGAEYDLESGAVDFFNNLPEAW